MKTIDGSLGEGGGQILRSSLSLSVVTQTPVEVINVRAGRRKPGLLRQHLCAVKAAAAICDGAVEGAELKSGRVVLRPNPVRPGEHHFSVGSAGSASLVLQTVLPPLMVASEPSVVIVEGGTHNPHAPPFEFLERVFAPAVQRMGVGLEVRLERAGFYPTGGGRIVAEIRPPTDGFAPFTALERGPLIRQHATIVASGLPAHVARREEDTLRKQLGPTLTVGGAGYESYGPGNAVLVELEFRDGRAVFVGHGERGKRAEVVAKAVVKEAQTFMEQQVPVDVHLADQLLLPMALGEGGRFRTGPLSPHTTTNIEVLRAFLPVDITCASDLGDGVTVRVEPKRPPR